MKIIGVIPARWGSTRFEGKVLANILGKPMIQHVWEQVKKSRKLNDLIIACDDQRVLRAANNFGAKAFLTSRDHASGSDRIAEVVKKVGGDIIINVQGDEPLIHFSVIDRLVAALMNDKTPVVATPIKMIRERNELDNPNIVKVVVNKKGYALYFSRAAIPYHRDSKDFKKVTYYKHLGIYAYRKNFLLKFCKLPKSILEQTEKLEQLRVLEAGFNIKTVLTDIETIGVDTPEDLAKVEAYLRKRK